MYSSGKNTHRKHSEGGGSFNKIKTNKSLEGLLDKLSVCFILSKLIGSLNYLLSHLVTALSCTVKASRHSREKSLVLFFALNE